MAASRVSASLVDTSPAISLATASTRCSAWSKTTASSKRPSQAMGRPWGSAGRFGRRSTMRTMS